MADLKTLWARSAGRCQLPGCNKVTYRVTVTQDTLIAGEQAHIVGFKENGPRGKQRIPDKEINCYLNLMVLCEEHHKNIDKTILSQKYTVALLRQWKREHEDRIEMVTSISPYNQRHVVTYATLIGQDLKPVSIEEAADALFPSHFPAECKTNDMSLNSSFQDSDSDNYWDLHARCLRKKVADLKERLRRHKVQEFAIFAIAPQPLLILLGTLFPELKGVKVYQRHKHPNPSWKWPDSGDYRLQEIVTHRPRAGGRTPVLILEFSAEVEDQRVLDRIPDASIYRIGVAEPNNDVIKCPSQLVEFHQKLRTLLDEIKAKFGQDQPLHIFPVGAVSISVECGKARAPKADSPWVIYDQNNQNDGFQAVMTIDEKAS